MSYYNIPKNGPVAWYLERYGYGIGAGSPGVDEEWVEMLLGPKVEVVQQPIRTEGFVSYQPFPWMPLLFLVFLIIFVLTPVKFFGI